MATPKDWTTSGWCPE